MFKMLMTTRKDLKILMLPSQDETEKDSEKEVVDNPDKDVEPQESGGEKPGQSSSEQEKQREQQRTIPRPKKPEVRENTDDMIMRLLFLKKNIFLHILK